MHQALVISSSLIWSQRTQGLGHIASTQSSEALWQKCASENSKTQVLRKDIDRVWGVAGRELERQYVHGVRKRDGEAGKKWLTGLLPGNARKHQDGKDWMWEGFQDEQE